MLVLLVLRSRRQEVPLLVLLLRLIQKLTLHRTSSMKVPSTVWEADQHYHCCCCLILMLVLLVLRSRRQEVPLVLLLLRLTLHRTSSMTVPSTVWEADQHNRCCCCC